MEWLAVYQRRGNVLSIQMLDEAERARDFTEFVVYPVVRLPGKKVSTVSTEEFTIFARLVIWTFSLVPDFVRDTRAI